MLSHEHRFLFIHVPRTGGNAIQNVLRRFSDDEIVTDEAHHDGVERFEVRSPGYPGMKKHSTLAEWAAVLEPGTFADLHSFAVVRNPWERMVSMYFHAHRGNPVFDRVHFKGLIERNRPAWEFITLSDDSTAPDVDSIIRFERLGQEFADVVSSLNIEPEPLPVRNASARGAYVQYYDDELEALVAERFAHEIDHFGYEFGG